MIHLNQNIGPALAGSARPAPPPLFFFCFFLGIVRDKRSGRGGRGENAWCVKYKSIEFCCSQETAKELS